MELAASLSREKSMHSSSLPMLLSSASDGLTLSSGGAGDAAHSHNGESDDEAEREAALLLDAAVTLCAIAAKKVCLMKFVRYLCILSRAFIFMCIVYQNLVKTRQCYFARYF